MSEQETPAFLGVECSLKNRKWRLRSTNERLGLTIAQRLGVPEIVGRVLAGRNVDIDGAERYLSPTLRDLMPDPSSFKDMDVAAARIVEAIQSGQTIAVFGDYDVDGATSSGVLKRFFDMIGVPLVVYIPDRMEEGYGPNINAFNRLKGQGVDLIITVDCGIVAFDVLDQAADTGLDVIIVDHHQAETRLPKAVAVVNPKRHDESQEYTYLAAVGVAFLLLVAVNRDLRKLGWYADRKEPNLMALLDLVALGTVCDIVPLHGLNRAFVTQGLKVMARRANPGLVALSDVAGLDETPGTYHLGFLLGPRVNAGGRVGKADFGARLLSSNNPSECQELARYLNEYNQERKDIEVAVTEEAMDLVEKTGRDKDPVLVVAGEGWHPGVIGIVASRLKDAYQRPTIVIGLDGAEGKGSGRSMPGVDLGAAIGAARHKELLLAGGGHAMAAGLTVARDKVADLTDFLMERLSKSVDTALQNASLGIDGALGLEGATVELVTQLEQAGPYGAGNPEPRFVLSNVRIATASIVGENHVRCILTGAGGRGRLAGICFRSLETPLGDSLLNHQGASFHIAGHLKKNTWRGQTTPQLMIEDAYRRT
ncbi:single-stranded-DNA-specific exonuclease RecJ [Sneathiella chinensis]|uniref:Single-stranded-DNA-specific exonuclease RecJ n=1 Tax=Sneathiella chinensis TaxID=349750 RepID=A0ABQ5U8U9_9PROT|nr:single-stranded-DNA-specific exonuclease RecJ [Sneathiella chinensis]GLQ07615.1 single-stranded-DNA-specific exonuclease RecJ [Sneathiella chinensis]